MIYTNLDALALAAFQLDPADTESVRQLQRLIGVYFDALYNPPDGVIGVGAITYAEDVLAAAQMDLNYDEKGNWVGPVANENGWTP
jgi:hypothetical protein